MKKDLLIIAVISAVILLLNLGGGSLSSWDEAFYAEVSREIADSGNWIDLTWGGGEWNDKPPLYMWITACFYKLFGVNEFSARLLSAIAGMMVILVTYLLAFRIFSRRTALLAAIMLMSTYHFIWFSKMGTLDVTFTLFISLAIYSFLTAEVNRVTLLYSCLWTTLAFMTKGTGALLVPLILGPYVLIRRDWTLVFNRYLASGVLIFFLIVGSWYTVAFMHYGGSVVDEHFIKHLFLRTTRALHGHEGDWITYFNVILYKGKPWGAVGLVMFPFLVFYTFKQKLLRNVILISWVIITFTLFTLVKTKLHWYIMPVYPPLIIAGAWGVDNVLRRWSVPVTAIVALASVAYFGIKKDIFTLDYNPDIKKMAARIQGIIPEGGHVYLYEIGDPGIQYYFGGFSKNIRSDEDYYAATNEEGAVVMVRSEEAAKLDIRGKEIPLGNKDYSAILVGSE